MKWIGNIFIVVFFTILLSGCWGRAELKDISIVSGFAIDRKEDNQFELTTEAIKPGEEQKAKVAASIVRSSTGVTVFEAVRDQVIVLGKKQNWQHVQAFIIGEEIAKTGVTSIIDFFDRDHEPRFRMNLLVANGKAKEILKIKSDVEKLTGSMIKKAVEEQGFVSKAPNVELHDFSEMLIDPYQDPYLPLIRKGQQGFEIVGTAVFKQDKMVGELSPLETRGLLRTLGELKGGLQVLTMDRLEDKEPIYMTIEIKKSSSTIKAKIENDTPKIFIDIQERGFIGDISAPIDKKFDQKLISQIEKLYADAIKKEVEQVVSKIQKKYKSNVLSFPGVINRENKQYWKEHKENWHDIYPNVQVVVNVETKIPENGLMRNNIGY